MKGFLALLALMALALMAGCSSAEKVDETKPSDVKLDISPEQKAQLDNGLKHLDKSKLKG